MKEQKMQLEDYFDFLAPDDIRIKGHRIGIETVLYDYVHRERTAEEIQRAYPSLSLEEVYATILYYLHNQEQMGAYLADYLEYCRQARERARNNPSPAAQRLLALREEINAYPPEEREAARQRIIERERAKRQQEAKVGAAG